MAQPTIFLQHGNQDWILSVIARDLKKFFGAKVVYFPTSRRNVYTWIRFYFCKPTGNMIFLHQEVFLSVMKYKNNYINSSKIIFYTHKSHMTPEHSASFNDINLADKIIVCSTSIKNALIDVLGVESSAKIRVVIGGADISYFQLLNLKRNARSVILVSKFKERKRPDLILRTVRENKDIEFLLHGKDWSNSKYLEKLNTCDNFKYIEFNFKNANKLYNDCSIFMSLSDLEGAPMPALEALAAGCKVILTDTGFARDLEQISGSVVVIPVNPSTQEVTEAIDLALSLPYPKSDVIQFFSYQNFLKECVII